MSKRVLVHDENRSSLSKKQALDPGTLYFEDENLINDIFSLDIVKHDDDFACENVDSQTYLDSNEDPLQPDSTKDITTTSSEFKIVKIEPASFSFDKVETSLPATPDSLNLTMNKVISLMRPSTYEYSLNEIRTSSSQPSTSFSPVPVDELHVSSADVDDFETELLMKVVFPLHPIPANHRRKASNIQCVIEKLKDHPFASEKWSDRERQDIIKHGMPELKTSDFSLWMDPEEAFKVPTNFMKKVPWLTGCIKLRILICWPCLIAGDCGVWSIGYNLNNQFMTDSCNHSTTKTHLRNVKMTMNLIKHYSAMSEPNQDSTTKSTGPIDMIDTLLKHNFLGIRWTDAQRCKIIENGKPVPEIRDFKYAHFQKSRTYLRSFHIEHYSNIVWLTGSAYKKKLFCWPCLLFNNQGVWGKSGFNNLSNLYAAVSRHEINTDHLNSSIMLKAWESRITTGQPIVTKLGVNNNPDVLKNLIDTICYSITRNSLNARDDFFELMQLIGGTNPKVNPFLIGNQAEVNNYAQHLSTALVSYLKAGLTQELEHATFVSLILSEVARIDITSWIALIVRYVNGSGVIKERFVTYIVVNPEISSDEIIAKVCTKIFHLQCASRVVGCTYDGSFTNHVDMAKFHIELKKLCKYAFFFPHKDHRLMHMVEQVLSRFVEVRDFFHLLSKINRFAIRHRSVLLKLDKELVEKLSKDTDVSLDLVPLFAKNFKPILRIFQTIAKKEKSWSNQDILEARVFVNTLLTIQCRFKIVLLHEVIPALTKLSDDFQSEQKFHRWNFCSIQFYSDTMATKDAGWSSILSRAITLNGETEVCVDETISNNFVVCFEQVLDTVSQLVLARASDLDSFGYYDITFNNQCRQKNELLVTKLTIPTEKFQPILKFWPYFDCKRLVEFLNFAIWQGHIQGATLLDKFNNIRLGRLIDTFPDLYKFLKLIFTIPMVRTDEVSAINELKKYVKEQKQLDVQETFLWMGREYLAQDKRDGAFYSEVYDHFQKTISL